MNSTLKDRPGLSSTRDGDRPGQSWRMRAAVAATPTGRVRVDLTDQVTDLWSVQDASAFLRVPVGTLYQWRHRRVGPRAYKVGRHLRYDPAEVRAWLREQAE